MLMQSAFIFFEKIVNSSILNDNGGSPLKIPEGVSSHWCRAEDQTHEGKEAKDLVGSQVRSKARMLGGFGLGCSTISWEFFASILGKKPQCLH